MIIRILLLVFTIALAWIINVANSGGSNFILEAVDTIPNGDKIGHFFVMGTFAYLVNLLLECKTFKLGSLNVLKGSTIVFVFVLIEEITHMFIRTRTFSYFDLLSDILGIVAFGILAVKTYPTISQLLKSASRQRPSGYDTPTS